MTIIQLHKYTSRPNATAITLDKSSISLTTVGQTEQLTATLTPINAGNSIIWSSNDTTVATVDQTGLVTCVTPGTCTITATTDNGLTATCGVTQERTPGVNTLVYYKFEGNLTNEVSGTVDASFNGSGSYDTIGGVLCANLNNSGVAISAKLPSGDFTMSWYGNFITFPISSDYNGIFGIQGTMNGGVHFQFTAGPKLNLWNYGDNIGDEISISDGYTTGQWYYYTLVRVNGVATFYVNGVSQGNMTIGGNNSQTVQYYIGYVYNTTRYYHGYMSKFIMENGGWTAGEITNYFDATKGDYGIS